MYSVKLSSKYQVVIPRRVRESLGLKPGEKFHVLSYGGRVEFIPVKRMKEMRGYLKGMDSEIEREEEDRL